MAKKAITEEEAYNKVAARCVQREYCRADWYRKLLDAGLSAAQVDQVLDRLEDERFIDESRYSRSFVHDKLLYDRWGRIKISYALRQKGIATQVITAAFEQIDESEYIGILKDLLKQKGRSVKGDNAYACRQKIARFAVGRGFEPGLVFQLLDLDDDEV